jgi:hypothetical protein
MLLQLIFFFPSPSLHVYSVRVVIVSITPGALEMRLSGLQRQVLSLYRQCLREAKKKPSVCPPDNSRSGDRATDKLARRCKVTLEIMLGRPLPVVVVR